MLKAEEVLAESIANRDAGVDAHYENVLKEVEERICDAKDGGNTFCSLMVEYYRFGRDVNEEITQMAIERVVKELIAAGYTVWKDCHYLHVSWAPKPPCPVPRQWWKFW